MGLGVVSSRRVCAEEYGWEILHKRKGERKECVESKNMGKEDELHLLPDESGLE